MGRTVRLFEGRFGRLLLNELAPNDQIQAQADPAIVLEQGAEEILLLNPGELHVTLGPTRALEFHAASEWLRASFPAAFEPEELRPFPLHLAINTPIIDRRGLLKLRGAAADGVVTRASKLGVLTDTCPGTQSSLNRTFLPETRRLGLTVTKTIVSGKVVFGE